MKLWEEGRDREERIALRQAEDEVREGLIAKYHTTGDRELFAFLDYCRTRREEIEMTKTRGRKPKSESIAAKLVAALDFVSIAQKDTAQGAYQTHVQLGQHFAVASDGVLSAGHPIDEDLSCCPHTEQLRAALKKVGTSLSMTQADNGRLSITGQKLKAHVACINVMDMPHTAPDPAQYPINDAVKAAMSLAVRYTREGGSRVFESAVLMQTNSCVGTDGKGLIEAWHGVSLPTLIVPRAFVVAVGKQDAPLAFFGFTDTTLTFHFEGGAWIKTQLYAEGFPDVARILDQAIAPVAIPADLFDGIAAVMSHNERGHVTLAAGEVRSNTRPQDDEGATYEVAELVCVEMVTYPAKYLQSIADVAQAIDINTARDRLYWVGACTRGVIMGVTAS